MAAIALLGGCGDDDSASTSETVPPTSAGPSRSSTGSTGTAGSTGSLPGELSADEDLANNPPPPADVRVVAATADGVELAWEPPPAVSVPHAYSDEVVSYRVFRRVDDELELRPYAETSERRFVDPGVAAGHTYAYAISSVREQNVEGSRSDPPTVARVSG